MFEDQINKGVFVTRVNCFNEAVMVCDRRQDAVWLIIRTRSEERVTNACMIDQQPSKTRLKIGIGGHLADDFMKSVVREDHRDGVAREARISEPVLHPSQIHQLPQFDVPYGEPADRCIDHWRDKKKMSQP